MSATLEAAVAAQDAQDAVEPEVVSGDTPLAPAAPTPTAKPPISLDDILPDTDDLPPTLRGKSVRALADDRRTTVHQRDTIGTEKNNLESQLRVAQAALTVLGQVAPQRQPEAPPAKPTALDLLKKRGIDTAVLLTDPERVLAGAIDAGAELAKAELAGEIQALQQRLDDLTGERAVEKTATANERIKSAHTQAGRTLKVDPEKWVDDAEFVTSFVLSRGLAVDDPQSYVTAGEALYKRTGAAPTPTPAPAPAAPPVGNGAPAPVAVQGNGSAVASLTARERQDFDDIVAGFGERIKISDERKERIAREVIATRKRRRG